jgi:WXG100 family type VII secretion target
MSYLKVTADELHSVASQLTATAANVAAENTQALGRVNGLVGQGWEGAASGQFEVLFNQWKTSADQLMESLNGISQLLSGAGTAYAETEAGVARSMAG